jgi:uncharacterized protein with PIN domain
MNLNTRDISKAVKLSEETQYAQQVIINGIPQQGETVKIPILICPTCNVVLVRFNQGTSYLQAIETAEKQVSQTMKYCSHCGQKLSFPSIINNIEVTEE